MLRRNQIFARLAQGCIDCELFLNVALEPLSGNRGIKAAALMAASVSVKVLASAGVVPNNQRGPNTLQLCWGLSCTRK